MKRALVIGNASSIWTREYVYNIHLKIGNKVEILTFDTVDSHQHADYIRHDVHVHKIGCGLGKLDKIYKAIAFIAFCVYYRLWSRFDILDIQSPPHSFQGIVLGLGVKILNIKTIVTFWGSDIMRITGDESRNMYGIIKNSDIINLATEGLREAFRSLFGNEFNRRMVACPFGSMAFEPISKYRNKQNGEAKKVFGLNPLKTTVAIGYNGNKAQQHVDVLDSLSKLDIEYKEKIQIILHMGYGSSKGYTELVKNHAEKCGVEYVILTDMYSLDDVGKLRLATDIMIHAQTTDAFSGSIRECLYAESIVLNPEWIEYSELDDLGIKYVKYRNIDEISILVKKILMKEIEVDVASNVDTMYREFSWEGVLKRWSDILDERTT